MKNHIIILSLFLANSVTAQQLLDTIYANDKKNVALFFPNPVCQGITGSDNFVFTFNREKEQYFGLLQATPGTESNLLALTNDGQVYSYIVSYKEKLSKLNYFIEKKESIGNERPIKKTLITKKKSAITYADRISYFQSFSEYLRNLKHGLIAKKYKKGIWLQLRKVAYNASEVYLVIEIENTSGIDFEVDYLNINITNGNKRRKSSFQSLAQKVIYKYKMPSVVKDNKLCRLIYVLPKFVLGDDENLLIELQELNGSRGVVLETTIN